LTNISIRAKKQSSVFAMIFHLTFFPFFSFSKFFHI